MKGNHKTTNSRRQTPVESQRETSEENELHAIETLVATRHKNEKAISDKTESLQTLLDILTEAVKPPQCENCPVERLVTERDGCLAAAFKERDALQEKISLLAEEINDQDELRQESELKTNRSIVTLVIAALVFVAFIVAIGKFVGTGHWQVPTTVVKPVTESLESFVARESAMLTADERSKLIQVTEKILGGHFETPESIEEEFVFQRKLAGIESETFYAFREKWSARVKEMNLEDSVGAMQSIYTSLLHGLKVQAYSDFTGGSVEGLGDFVPSIITPFSTVGDEPNTPEVLLVDNETALQEPQNGQQQRILRRR